MCANIGTSSEAAVVSSPAPVIFSDEVERASSPPSSPPGFPWEQHTTQESNNKHILERAPSLPPIKSAFSVLGKRKALSDVAANARPAKKCSANHNACSKPLTQLQISLGQQVQVKCKTCGMEYVSSSAEDRDLHAKYHKQTNEGYTVGKDFVRGSPQRQLLGDPQHQGSISVVDCHDRPHRIRHAQTVLSMVEKELGAAPLLEKAVWLNGTALRATLVPPYSAYMYICDSKCIGFLLVQKIETAFAVLEPFPSNTPRQTAPSRQHKSALAALRARQQAPVDHSDHQPLQISRSVSRACMGVARIWTAPAHRHENIATMLLDAAFAHQLQRPRNAQPSTGGSRSSDASAQIVASDPAALPLTISKALVAFSQPTEAGTRLATKWFGKRYGWLVYVD